MKQIEIRDKALAKKSEKEHDILNSYKEVERMNEELTKKNDEI